MCPWKQSHFSPPAAFVLLACVSIYAINWNKCSQYIFLYPRLISLIIRELCWWWFWYEKLLAFSHRHQFEPHSENLFYRSEFSFEQYFSLRLSLTWKDINVRWRSAVFSPPFPHRSCMTFFFPPGSVQVQLFCKSGGCIN